MKYPRNYKYFIFFILLLGAIFYAFDLPDDNSKIHGVWKVEEDHNSKWEFTSNGIMKSSYIGSGVIDNYSWVINHKSPQCGIEVELEEGIDFLQLTDRADNSNSCFYIMGLNETRLTLINVDTGHMLKFIKE